VLDIKKVEVNHKRYFIATKISVNAVDNIPYNVVTFYKIWNLTLSTVGGIKVVVGWFSGDKK